MKYYLNYCKKYLTQIKQKKPLTSFDISIFLRQFSTLISSGIPIVQSCDILEKSQEKIALRILIYSIKREILTGKSFSSSLQNHPAYFDVLTCHLIQIGEYTGKLDVMLLTVANYWEENLAFKKSIKQALFYPCIICLFSITITFGMFIFVIPRFAELFQDSQVKLPLLTSWIFYLASKMKDYLSFAIVIVGMLVFFQKRFNIKMTHHLKTSIIKLPIIQFYLKKIMLARFARNLAITFAAGIPVVESLKLMTHANGHPEFSKIIIGLRNKVSAGLQLHHAMTTFSYFPVLMVQMIKIGEESGMLDAMLDKIADFLESDVDHIIARLNQLLEPLIMIMLGVLIGGLVIGMYLPIFKLGTTL